VGQCGDLAQVEDAEVRDLYRVEFVGGPEDICGGVVLRCGQPIQLCQTCVDRRGEVDGWKDVRGVPAATVEPCTGAGEWVPAGRRVTVGDAGPCRRSELVDPLNQLVV